MRRLESRTGAFVNRSVLFVSFHFPGQFLFEVVRSRYCHFSFTLNIISTKILHRNGVYSFFCYLFICPFCADQEPQSCSCQAALAETSTPRYIFLEQLLRYLFLCIYQFYFYPVVLFLSLFYVCRLEVAISTFRSHDRFQPPSLAIWFCPFFVLRLFSPRIILKVVNNKFVSPSFLLTYLFLYCSY